MTTKAEFGIIWNNLDSATRLKIMKLSLYGTFKVKRKTMKFWSENDWGYMDEFTKAHLVCDYDLLKFNEILNARNLGR